MSMSKTLVLWTLVILCCWFVISADSFIASHPLPIPCKGACGINQVNDKYPSSSFLKTRTGGLQSVKKWQSGIVIASGAAGEVKKNNAAQEQKRSDLTTSSFNLAKSIVGGGVLSLPSGIAFFSSDKSALLPSATACTIFGLLAAYSFSTIGKLCHEHKVETYKDAWAKSVSPQSAVYISMVIMALTALAVLAGSIIVGDSFTTVFQTFGIPAAIASRTNVILFLTTFLLLPLCSLTSLKPLAPFSLLGLGGILYTAIFMVIRLFDGSYAPGGRFFSEVVAKPLFTNEGYKLDYKVFVLLSMLSKSFIAHYNAPRFYNELEDNTIPRFNAMVGSAFAVVNVLNVLIMSVGFLTFGGASAGFALNNYAKSDILATISLAAIGMALITGFPFTFFSLRDSLLDFFGLAAGGAARKAAIMPVTIGILVATTAVALVLKDVGFVVSISGAMFGCSVMLVFPMIMNIANNNKHRAFNDALRQEQQQQQQQQQKKNKSKRSDTAVPAVASKPELSRVELLINYGIIGTGLTMSAVGVAVSVMRQMGRL